MRRAAFRFGFVLAVLVMFPFPLGIIPGLGWLVAAVTAPIRWGVFALAALLGLPEPSHVMTGSGDTLFHFLELLLFAIVAAVATTTWLAVDRDRRRRDHARLARGLRIALRYWLAAIMCTYGVAKLFEFQFQTPPAWILDQRVGDKSPMGLMWTFMGYSRPYTMLAGGAEALACVLLLWRRTATLGALVGGIVMVNVVAMNFCYDVPVKLFSLELVAALWFVAAPDLRHIIGAALGHPTRGVEPVPRLSPRLELVRRIVKLVFVAHLVGFLIMVAANPRVAPPTELDGAWDVEQFASTATEPWARLMVGNGVLAVRTTTERRLYYRATIDPAAHAITLQPPIGPSGLLIYRWSDADHLAIEGQIGTRRYEVTLARKPWLLMTRGFHWIQEEPFHR